MLYAILYLDTGRRLRIYNDGAVNREIRNELGWCMEEDAAPPWEDEKEALEQLARIATHLQNLQAKRETNSGNMA